MKKILIVCTGNTCRSPMAGGMARKIGAAKGIAVEVRTAGLSATDRKVAPNALAAMNEVGMDISSDYPKPVTRELIHWADVIIPVTQQHAARIKALYPLASEKILPLTQDVPDPIGRDLPEYRACRDQIEHLLLRLAIWSEPKTA